MKDAGNVAAGFSSSASFKLVRATVGTQSMEAQQRRRANERDDEDGMPAKRARPAEQSVWGLWGAVTTALRAIMNGEDDGVEKPSSARRTPPNVSAPQQQRVRESKYATREVRRLELRKFYSLSPLSPTTRRKR